MRYSADITAGSLKVPESRIVAGLALCWWALPQTSLAGGALAGGRVYGDWPGLTEAALYQGRDLMPTADVRYYPALALQALFGLDRTAIGRDVFPGLDLDSGPRFIA